MLGLLVLLAGTSSTLMICMVDALALCLAPMSRSVNSSRKLVTVNLEIFARTLFSRNFAYAYAKFRENKTLAKWQNHSVVY